MASGRLRGLLTVVLSTILIIILFSAASYSEPDERKTVGFSVCKICHSGEFNSWSLSLHKDKGVECEICHGPGSLHSKKPSKTNIAINVSSRSCSPCHSTGDLDSIPAEGNMLKGRIQVNEFLASPHAGKLTCVSCHDPHSQKVVKSCSTCHEGKEEQFKGTEMEEAGVKCIDCHMPEAVKLNEGSEKSHLIDINTDPNARLTYFVDDRKVGSGYLTLEWSCLTSGCHNNKNIKWASELYGVAHGAKELTRDIKEKMGEIENLSNQLSEANSKIKVLQEEVERTDVQRLLLGGLIVLTALLVSIYYFVVRS